MENTTSRNSIILKNIPSPYIEQAIFILKKEAEFEDDIVAEAEKIIENFINRRKQKRKLNRYIKRIVTTVAVFTIILSSVLLVYFSIQS